MKEEWLFPNAAVPVDTQTTLALLVEIKRLIDVVGGMALAQRPWVGLTGEDFSAIKFPVEMRFPAEFRAGARWAEAKLKEKNA